MREEVLLHYAPAPVKIEPRRYAQNFFKPVGFWVSVGDAWREWCEGSDFGGENLRVCHRVTLAADANILRVATAADTRRLVREFQGQDQGPIETIDWRKLADYYQGIIVSPYNYSLRLSLRHLWYNAWDCASGCIWDVAAIQDVTVEPK